MLWIFLRILHVHWGLKTKIKWTESSLCQSQFAELQWWVPDLLLQYEWENHGHPQRIHPDLGFPGQSRVDQVREPGQQVAGGSGHSEKLQPIPGM